MILYKTEKVGDQWRITHQFQSPYGINGSVETLIDAESEDDAIALAKADAEEKMAKWLKDLGEA